MNTIPSVFFFVFSLPLSFFCKLKNISDFRTMKMENENEAKIYLVKFICLKLSCSFKTAFSYSLRFRMYVFDVNLFLWHIWNSMPWKRKKLNVNIAYLFIHIIHSRQCCALFNRFDACSLPPLLRHLLREWFALMISRLASIYFSYREWERERALNAQDFGSDKKECRCLSKCIIVRTARDSENMLIE